MADSVYSLIAFYDGTGTGHRGRTLADIRSQRRSPIVSAIDKVRVRYTMQPVAARWMVVAKRTLSQT